MTSRCAALVILFIWLVPSLAFIPWILIYDETTFFVSGHAYVACHADWSDPRTGKAFTIAVVFLTCYFIPLAFIVVFCLLIGVRVWRRRVRGLLGPRTKRNILRIKTKVLKMLVVVVVLFALSWLPLYVIALRTLFEPGMARHEKALVRKYLYPVAQWLGAANSCVNPFIYCYYSSNFRCAVRQVLRRTAGRSGSVSTTR